MRQVAEQEARRRSADAHAASLHQRDVQLAQIEELNDRILADRCAHTRPDCGGRSNAHDWLLCDPVVDHP